MTRKQRGNFLKGSTGRVANFESFDFRYFTITLELPYFSCRLSQWRAYLRFWASLPKGSSRLALEYFKTQQLATKAAKAALASKHLTRCLAPAWSRAFTPARAISRTNTAATAVILLPAIRRSPWSRKSLKRKKLMSRLAPCLVTF